MYTRNAVQSQSGYTLLELTLIVAILGIVAVAAMPDLVSTRPYKLDLAAEDFAEAVRFARSEAMRTGNPHGFWVLPGQKRIKVYRANLGTNPPTPVYDVYHPVSKRLYTIEINTHPFAAADTITAVASWEGTCDTPAYTTFNGQGIPFCGHPYNVILRQEYMTLTLGAHSRVVNLQGFTGRVTVQ